ncbi:MAG: glycosyl hydrolase family 18 protein [Candidatus Moranbacteria bacterium]|nr:glycosyl hydrolase family 18 protein [Candidatus Moranbacteria bacterium]
MFKKILIGLLLAIALISAFFHFSHQKKNIISLNNAQNINAIKETKKEVPIATTPSEKIFFISGWLPYWQKLAGADSLSGNLSLFSEINPFAFGVNPDGTLRDTLGIKNAPWPALRIAAQKENVAIVPTIIWADAPAMHATFSDSQKLENHISTISAMLTQNNFPGVDIDYEGKDATDRDLFSTFLEALRKKLEPAGKTLSCTVEARTQDNPPPGWTGTRAMSFANDYLALNKFCDHVRIMAYDQMFQVNGEKKLFDDTNEIPTAPNADIRWVEKVMRYTLQYISPDKLVLGVPTYGWEFRVTKTATGYHYEKVKSVTYPQALEEKTQNKATIGRTDGGEPFFSYTAPDGKHLVTFSDVESLAQKINLAKNLNLKGISLFKIDGQTDPELFSVIKKEITK